MKYTAYGLVVASALLGQTAYADEWASVATRSTIENDRICYSDATDIICDDSAPTLTDINSLVSGGGGLWTASGSDIYFSGGRVGIGTSSPVRTLDVEGNVRFNGSVYSSGNIGIGTATPEMSLHIGSANPRIQFTDTDTGADSVVSAASSNGSIYLLADINQERADSVIGFHVDGERKMTITEAGNVGIGVQSPTAKLDVSGVNAQFGDLGIITNYPELMFNARWDTADARKEYVKSETAFNIYHAQGTDILSFGYAAEGLANEPVSFTSALSIDTSGHIGISDTTADFPLSIGDTTQITQAQIGGTSPLYLMRSYPGIGFNAYYDGSQYLYGAGSNERYAGAITHDVVSGTMRFMVSGSPGDTDETAALTTRMAIAANGNVGIGTATPSARLAVAGNVKLDASAPYINFGDKNTIYATAGDKLYFTDGGPGDGVQLMIDNSTYRVGIGTTTPGSKLDVAGTIRAQELCDETGANCTDLSTGIGGSVTADSLDFTELADSMVLDATTNIATLTNDLTVNTDDFVIDGSTGFVGIGTASPREALEVLGGGLLFGARSGSQTDPWSNATNYALGLSMGVDTTPHYFEYYNDAGAFQKTNYFYRYSMSERWSRNSADGTQRVAELSGGNDSTHNFDIYDSTSNTVNVRLASDAPSWIKGGNLGIGTSAPAVPIHVYGGTDASLSNGSGYILVGSEGSTNVVIDDNEIMARNNGAGGNLSLQASSGTVIVGGATPVADVKLNVAGAIKIAATESENCAATEDLGKIRFNASLGKFQICRP